VERGQERAGLFPPPRVVRRGEQLARVSSSFGERKWFFRRMESSTPTERLPSRKVRMA
jgi:hypothetical protein